MNERTNKMAERLLTDEQLAEWNRPATPEALFRVHGDAEFDPQEPKEFGWRPVSMAIAVFGLSIVLIVGLALT